MSIKLNFKATNIAKAEREDNVNFFEAITELGNKPSVSGIYFIYKAGGASDEEFDEAFSNGMDKAVSNILEGLGEAGFLPKEEVEKTLNQNKKTTKTSPNSGEVNRG